MSKIRLCLFAATPDILERRFLVRVLTGTPRELAERAVAWGYDGIELLPDPTNVPDPEPWAKALRDVGAVLPVVNTGRMAAQGMALLHADAAVRQRSLQAFKKILDFAGALGAQVGLGVARGRPSPGLDAEARDRLAEDVFRELAGHAERVGTVILLEAAEPEYTRFIATTDEVRCWVDRVASPTFGMMLDTQQLTAAEPSIEYGIRAAKRQAKHIHLFDPSRWPPGAGPATLDWDHVFRVLREEGFAGTGSVALVPEGDPEPGARQVVSFLRRATGAGIQE